MPNLRKAARGKRRWVGIEIDLGNIDESGLFEQLTPESGKPRLAWTSNDGCFLILEVRLENHRKLIDSIECIDYAKSITSSGKIRLVKARISQLCKNYYQHKNN